MLKTLSRAERLKILSAVEGLKTLTKPPSVKDPELSRRAVEGSKVEEKKLVLVVVCIGCLLWGFEPMLGANAPADMEKKKQDSLFTQKLRNERAAKLEKVAAFRQAYPGVELHPNPVTGVPDHLYGDLSKGQTQSEPVEAAYEFLEQNKDLYGITNPRDELKVKGVAKDQYGAMVDLKQVYRGVDIYQAGMSVHFTSAGKLKGITGGFAHISDLSSTPSIDSLSAIGIARKDLNLPKNYRSKILEWSGKADRSLVAWLFITSLESKYRLVWIVGAYVDSPQAHWEYQIDAHSGAILKKKDTIKREPIRESDNRTSPSLPSASKDAASHPQRGPESSSGSGEKVPLLPLRPLLPKDSASGQIENKAWQTQDS